VPTIAQQAPARASLLYDPKLRAVVYQVVLTLVVVFLVYTAATNAVANLRAARIASGFGFLSTTSGFDVNQSFIPYSAATSTYGDAFLVGLLNTLVVSAIGIFFATILGFIVGIARLSKNWIVAKVAMVYVEVIRNLPLLLQLLFWYVAVLTSLPGPRQSLNAGDLFFLNQRGLYVPKPILADNAWLIPFMFVVGIVGTIAFRIWAKRQQEETGRQYPVGLTALALILGVPALLWAVLALIGGRPVGFDIPRLQGFNFRGGMQLYPEFVALLLGLVTYTAGFIAEVVRAGILAVSKGQTEAASALGLRAGRQAFAEKAPPPERVRELYA